MRQLFNYKELIFELTLRDLILQHRKPFFGFLWMLIIPFCTAIIYKVLFSDFFHATSGGYPFFIHLITALLPWNYFVSSIQRANRCILDSKNIISQIPFPKYLLPISAVLVNLVNFLPTLIVLAIFLIAFKIKLSLLIFFLPVVILIQTSLIIGLSFLVSSLQVIYRDMEYVIQIMLMALFFLTPGVYTLEELISKGGSTFAKIYMLNPLVGITNLYRIAFIGDYLSMLPKEATFFNTFINPILWSIALLFIGYFIFKKYEKTFLDYLNF
jgi:ABC-2 type transport system permease protein